jgi:hypothetical protein
MNWLYIREKYLKDHFIILAFAAAVLFMGQNTHYRIALVPGIALLVIGLFVWVFSELEQNQTREETRGPGRPGG